MLYTQVEFAFVAGLVVVVLLIPVNRVLAMRIQAASGQLMDAKDKRIKVRGGRVRVCCVVYGGVWVL